MLQQFRLHASLSLSPMFLIVVFNPMAESQQTLSYFWYGSDTYKSHQWHDHPSEGSDSHRSQAVLSKLHTEYMTQTFRQAAHQSKHTLNLFNVTWMNSCKHSVEIKRKKRHNTNYLAILKSWKTNESTNFMLSNPVVKLAPKCDKCCISNPVLLSENWKLWPEISVYVFTFLHFTSLFRYKQMLCRS